MRIALITQRFPPLCCGVGDYALGLARALMEEGHQVVVLTRAAAGSRPDGIRVQEVSLGGWQDLGSVLRVLESERVDRVQIEYSGYGWSHWGFSYWLNALIAVLRWRRIPVHLGLHETYIRFVDHPFLIPLSMLQRLHIWLLISTASSAYLNMPQRVRVLRHWLPWSRAKIQYRPNSSTIPVMALAEGRREEVRASHGVNSGDCVVAVFGLFQKDKNFEAVIDAVAHARTARPLRLWLLGDPAGAEPAYVAALHQRVCALGIADRVFWSGYLFPTDVSAHLQAADVFVLPQPDGHVTRSSVFMAAAAHGLPVIAVRNKNNQLEFEDGRNVLLAAQSDAREFAEKLEALTGAPALTLQLGTNLRRTYRDHFDWTVIVKAFAREDDSSRTHETAMRRAPVQKA